MNSKLLTGLTVFIIFIMTGCNPVIYKFEHKSYEHIIRRINNNLPPNYFLSKEGNNMIIKTFESEAIINMNCIHPSSISYNSTESLLIFNPLEKCAADTSAFIDILKRDSMYFIWIRKRNNSRKADRKMFFATELILNLVNKYHSEN